MNQRQVLAAVTAVVLLVATADFVRRIHVPRHHETREAGSFVPAVVAPPRSADRISKDLVSWLPKLRPIAPGSGAQSEADWTLTLLAVFDGPVEKGAVIQAKSPSGGHRIQRVAEGDELFGYKVSTIAPLRVVLTGTGGSQELRLFHPGGKGVGASGPPPGPAANAVGATESAAVPAVPKSGPPSPAVAAGATPAASGQPRPGAPAPASPGPKAVETKELKPGQAFELPESMRGLKFVKTPPQPQKAEGPAPSSGGAPPPKKP